MSQSKGKYIFLDASEEDKFNDTDEKKLEVFWRLNDFFPELSTLKILKEFHNLIIKFNPKINLVSKKTIHNSDLIHFYDSIVSCQHVLKDNTSETIYDIGSGNGFPGIIMSILDPSRKLVLVDRDRRKTEFFKALINQVSFKKC